MGAGILWYLTLEYYIKIEYYSSITTVTIVKMIKKCSNNTVSPAGYL